MALTGDKRLTRTAACLSLVCFAAGSLILVSPAWLMPSALTPATVTLTIEYGGRSSSVREIVLPMEGDVPPVRLESGPIRVEASASAKGRLRIWLNDALIWDEKGEVEDPSPRTEPRPLFTEFNLVRVLFEPSEIWPRPTTSALIPISVDETAAIGAAGAEFHTVARALEVRIDERGVRVTASARFEADDPRLDSLVEGESVAALMEAVHGSIALNGVGYALFDRSRPLWSIEEGQHVLMLESEDQPLELDEGQLVLSRWRAKAPEVVSDRLSLQVEELSLLGVRPRPDSMVDGVAHWHDAPERLTLRLGELGQSSTLGLLRSRDRWLPQGLRQFAHAGVGVLSILWATSLLASRTASRPLSRWRRGLLRLGRWLSCLGAAAGLSMLDYHLVKLAEGVVGIRVHGWPWPEDLQGGLWPHFIAGSGLVVCLALLLSAGCIATRRFWPVASRETTRALLFGSMIAVLLDLMQNVGPSTTPSNPATGLLVVGTLLPLGIGLGAAIWRVWSSTLRRRVHVSWGVTAIVVLATAALLWPESVESWRRSTVDAPVGHQISWDLSAWLFALRSSTGLVLAAFLVPLLAVGLPQHRESEAIRRFGLFLFAAVVVGPYPLLLLLPVPLFIALVVFRGLASEHDPRIARLLSHWRSILASRHELAEAIVAAAKDKHASLTVEQLKRKFEAKTLRADDLEKLKGPRTVLVETRLPGGERIPASDLVLAFGPGRSRRDSITLSLPIAAILSGLLVLVYAVPTYVQMAQYKPPSPALYLFRLLDLAGTWIISAMVFALLYPFIRGSSGWRKGLWFAGAIVACRLPVSLINSANVPDLAATVVSSLQTFVFFFAFGLLAFDRQTLQMSIKGHLEWGALRRATRLPGVATFGPILAATLGVAVTSAVTGQLASILGLVAQALIPEAPRPR